MNVHVAENWEPFLRAQVQSGRYRSEGEVVDAALRLLELRDAGTPDDGRRIESLLIEGLDSGPSAPMTREDWDEIERQGRRLIEVS